MSVHEILGRLMIRPRVNQQYMTTTILAILLLLIRGNTHSYYRKCLIAARQVQKPYIAYLNHKYIYNYTKRDSLFLQPETALNIFFSWYIVSGQYIHSTVS